MKMKNIRPYLAFASGISIAVVAAFFSITGLSKLFAGAALAIIVMGIILEAGKIIAASYVQRHYKEIGRFKTAIFGLMIFVLMLITSMGIYGFLTDAYQKTAHKFSNIQKQTEIIDKKETLVKNQIKRDEDLIISRNDREKTLTTLRATQENRIDNLLNANKNYSANNAQKGITDANSEIKQINIDISDYNKEINILTDSVNNFENKKLELSNSNDVAEVGPLKYISDLTGTPMDKVVNWVILMLIFVFDPLAMLLVISSQSLRKTEEETIEKREIKKELEIINNEQDIGDLEEKKEELKEEIIFNEPAEENWNENIEQTAEIIEPIEEIDIVKKDEDFEKYYKKQLDSIEKYRTKLSELLDVLYNDGKVQKGENLLNYLEFKDRVEKTFVKKFSIDDIRQFLTICNYLKITSLSGGKREALLSFEEAKERLKNYFEK